MDRDVTILVAVPKPGLWRETIVRHLAHARASVLLVEAYSGRELRGTHQHLHRPSRRMIDLLSAGLESVHSPYTLAVLPGDLPRVESLDALWNYMELQGDLLACGGYVFEHRIDQGVESLRPQLVHPSRQSEQISRRDRFLEVFRRPEKALTRLYRTKTLKEIMRISRDGQHNLPVALLEPFVQTMTALMGPTATLPILQAVIDPGASHRAPQLAQLAASAEGQRGLAIFFQILATELMSRDGIDTSMAKAIIDKAIHLYMDVATPSRLESDLLPETALYAAARSRPGFAAIEHSKDLTRLAQGSRRLLRKDERLGSEKEPRDGFKGILS